MPSLLALVFGDGSFDYCERIELESEDRELILNTRFACIIQH